ncbi:MAG TPA: hypothetical protein VN176_18950 [Verrucomicrobiae bacterium]|jgi:hypothetical protein|nr:hypothetical protein [Verrucomicrobiae bacterium]
MRNSMTKKWFSVVLVCGLLGCSTGALDRDAALKKIKAKTEGDIELRVAAGRVGSHCGFFELGGQKSINNTDPTTEIAAIVAVKAGYVTVTPDGKDYWQVNLTEKGRASMTHESFGHTVSAGCNYQYVKFLVARDQAVEVRGVAAATNDGTMCEVHYVWKWVSSDLGKSLQEDGSVYKQLTPQQQKELRGDLNASAWAKQWLEIPIPSEANLKPGRATFKKFDDGWRLQ